jgi:putative effector of murein hydrolase
MKLIEKRIYFIYILLGSLYFISKVIYYTCGFVCLSGVMLGLVATVLTILIGNASFKEYSKANRPIESE